jgi:hypothetical protein
MQMWIARGLGLFGTVALVGGTVNVLAPGAAFPSGRTCITDFDLIVCNIQTWALAPWLALVGVVAIAIAARILLGHEDAAEYAGRAEHTR